MAKRKKAYKFEKRRKELLRQKKKEEKRKRRLSKDNDETVDAAPEDSMSTGNEEPTDKPVAD
jgi:hypothetical protein